VLISVDGLLYACFYILTAFAVIAYYAKRIISNLADGLLIGILPVAAAGFLIWIIAKSLQTLPASGRWSLIGIVAAGLAVMVIVRVALRSPFFSQPREHAPRAER
jgi:hypothetical protein